jgi:hypothetical protein
MAAGGGAGGMFGEERRGGTEIVRGCVGKDATRIDGRSGEGAVRKGARSWRGVSANVSGIDSIVQRE